MAWAAEDAPATADAAGTQSAGAKDRPAAGTQEAATASKTADDDSDDEDEDDASASDKHVDADAEHAKALAGMRYPSATLCAACHPKQYSQWSMSQHAYAQMSPVFNAFQATLLKLTNGSNGDFCIRCHTPIGMNLGEAEFMSNIDRPPAAREGISCIVCHRINKAYGKVSGRLALNEGPLTSPVYGPTGPQARLQKVIDKAGLATNPESRGRQVHAKAEKFFQLVTPGFCATCHDVTLINGFRLEEAFSEYKSSPAAKRGVTCQDCHMGKEPGRTVVAKSDPDFDRKNYDFGPAAQVGSIKTEDRMLTNHMFVGPDYSVLTPALFPINARAIKEENQKDDPTAPGFATIRDWLAFNVKAGWGTQDFEDKVSDDYKFPDRWASVDDRYDARDIINSNEALLKMAREQRLKLLKTGFVLADIQTISAGPDGIRFKVQVKNGTDGHNVPTGFDAERLIWLHVTVKDADGKVIKESGDLDPNGDVRDLHSLYVHNGELPLDRELFSLQSKNVTTNLRGGEREQVLPVNYSATPLPFVRLSTTPTILLGHPVGVRKHKQGIDPLGERWAEYRVSADQLDGRGPYKAEIQLKAAMVPVNLLDAIKDVGFDYNMSARDVATNLVAGQLVVWEREVTFDVQAPAATAQR
ncbi:MAG: multiheme c-type cytochrome [Rhodanobacteraceae bacterium]